MVTQNTREILDALDDREHNCTPALFTITPVEKSVWRRDLLGTEFMLVFYCECETPHPSSYQKQFRVDHAWWKKIARPLRVSLNILASIAAPAGAGLPLLMDERKWELMQDYVKLSESVFEALPLDWFATDSLHLPTNTTASPPFSRSDLHEARLARECLNDAAQAIDAGSFAAGRWGDLRRCHLANNTPVADPAANASTRTLRLRRP
jgi:hypothetical protein